MQIVRNHINEKFTQDSDPIQDLRIGSYKLIEEWLKKYDIKDYRINNDLTIDVCCKVDIGSALRKHRKLPNYIQFNEIHGSFRCNWNGFKNMRGCPRIIHGAFYINGNPLTSLKGCPEIVGDRFCIAKGCGFTHEDIQKLCKVDSNNIDLSILQHEEDIVELEYYAKQESKR